MNITLIAALGHNRVIGLEGNLPWRCPQDWGWFKSTTSGKAVVMGRKTLQSLGEPLKNRLNIVVTRDGGFRAPESVVLSQSLAQGVALAQLYYPEVFVIGGGEIFEQAIPFANRLLITEIDYNGPGDTYFPEISKDEWEGTLLQSGDCGNGRAMEIWDYSRINPSPTLESLKAVNS